ncbi:MAG TPA: MFS transporter [Ktedonobacterales bacterium]|nr:MFS transporter [Ktedonobacterales bacterium]
MSIAEDRGEESAEAAETQALTDAAQLHASEQRTHDPYAALRFSDFRALIAGTSLSFLGEQMLTVAIGWDIYARTHSALMLGLVGLAQFAPTLALSLVAGHAADRYDRRTLVMLTQGLIALTSVGLALIALTRGPVGLIFGLLALRGVGEAFNVAAAGALPPQTVPVEHYENAASWSSSLGQLAAVLGPALGGIIIATRGDATLVYLLDALGGGAFIGAVSRIRGKQATRSSEPMTVEGLMGGVRFILQTRVILAAITLDMVAVLLGGATTLLPIYASDILHVGPQGLGLMVAMPSIGAILMATLQAYLPPWEHAGRTLLVAVGIFGLATLVFGVSRFFPLSLAALLALGAMDNISVVVRKTLLLLRTPDALRGRLSAVNNVFIGASNQVGGFESGMVAAALGPVASVVLGGIGSALAVVGIAWLWPELRALGRLTPIETDAVAMDGEAATSAQS